MGAAARRAVEEACGLLVLASPQALTASASQLHQAHSLLAGTPPAGSPDPPDTLQEVLRLRTVLHKAAALLERAHTYHNRWQSWMALAGEGYQPGGGPAAVVRQSTIYLRG